MKAVVMAGGEGTRLRPLTVNRPKPMVPLCNRPMMEYGLELLRKHGFREVIATLHYMPHVIMEYFGDGEGFGVRISYSIEEVPRGTAGGVKQATGHLDEPFLVISGDILTNTDLSRMLAFHRSRGAVLTIALTRVTDPTEYGIALLDDENRVTRYLEKPGWGDVFSDLANMGIYILEPEALKYVPENRPFDFSKDLFPRLLEAGEPVYGFIADSAYWSDVGTYEQYLQAHRDLLNGRIKGFTPPGIEVDRGVWAVDPGSLDGVVAEPPVALGVDAEVREGVRIGPYTVIGERTVVDRGAAVHRSVVWNDTYIGPGCILRSAIIGSSCSISAGCILMEGAVVGDMCSLGKYAVVKPGVKIWPSKRIDAYATVAFDLKWGVRWARQLFGPWGVEGAFNIEITPEFATRLGFAIGSWLPKGASVAVARDPYRSSRAIKRVLVSSLMAAGIKVFNLTVTPTPVLRYYVKEKGFSCGVMVETPVTNPSIVKVKVFGRDGIEIDEKAEKEIERRFHREEYRRVFSGDVGYIEYPTGYNELYVEHLLKHVKASAIARVRPKIVVDCGGGAASFIAPALLKRLGVDVVLLNAVADENAEAGGVVEMPREIEVVSAVAKAVKADLAVIFDEDADRVVFLDEKGDVVSSDSMLALLTCLVLERSGGGLVVAPATASRIVDLVAERLGGRVVRVKPGAKYVLHEVKRRNAVFGGEERGAYAFPEFQIGFDGIYALVKLLEYLCERSVGLSELASRLPKAYMFRESVRIPFKARGKVLRRLLEELREREIDTLDGIKVVEPTGWILVRPRPHEPLLDLYVESDRREEAALMLRRYVSLLNRLASS